MEFKEIKAKICPNTECNEVIPETWKASFQNDFCPKCGTGHDVDKIEKWRKEKGM